MVALFSLCIGLGAGLVFWVEPLIAKAILPLLGGSAAVWTTALMFFQAVLLCGYLYAFALSRVADARVQLAAHAAVLLAAAAFLPPSVRTLDWIDPAGAPVTAVLATLAAGVGLPLFALSATAPLVQHWFSRSGHRHAADPYFLYAASNLGSVGALLAFPLLLEPAAALRSQAQAWAVLFVLQALLIAGCGWLVRGRAAPAAPASAPPPRWRTRLHWLALAAVPSSLLSGVTTVITTDIASAPLLWVVPLVLYLATFAVAFARRQWLPRRVEPLLLPLALLPLLAAHLVGIPLPTSANLAVHYAVFFLAALGCHRVLAERRPAAARLTEFYAVMALGGLLGGAFNALVAPELFDGAPEFALVLVAAAALRPAAAIRAGELALPAVALVLALAAAAAVPDAWRAHLVVGLALVLGLGTLALAARPARFAAMVAVVFAVGAVVHREPATLLHAERNFYGTLRVVDDGDALVLRHGTTTHGQQFTDPARRREPLAYYWREGPLGQVFAAMAPRLRRVAAVGLGAGAVACYARPGQDWTFYEIDPAVVKIARDDGAFTYLADCTPGARVVVGDARLKLAAEAAPFDLIVLDAFSSDSIPLHLLTREAFALYRDRIVEDGLIALHISNRHLDLGPVVAALARDAGLAAVVRDGVPPAGSPPQLYRTVWVALGSEPALAPLRRDPAWRPLAAPAGQRAWTDDHSDLVSALRILRRKEAGPLSPAALSAPGS